MKRLFAVILAATALPLMAQGAPGPGPGMPPGKWWRRPNVVQRLQLTAEQQNRLDEIFERNGAALIDLKASVEKATLALRTELERPQLSREGVQRAAERVNEARGELFERELMMLVDMRGVLSLDQWREVRDTLGRQNEGPRPQGRREGARRQQPRPPRR